MNAKVSYDILHHRDQIGYSDVLFLNLSTAQAQASCQQAKAVARNLDALANSMNDLVEQYQVVEQHQQ